jgi:hypothetical protein
LSIAKQDGKGNQSDYNISNASRVSENSRLVAKAISIKKRHQSPALTFFYLDEQGPQPSGVFQRIALTIFRLEAVVVFHPNLIDDLGSYSRVEGLEILLIEVRNDLVVVAEFVILVLPFGHFKSVLRDLTSYLFVV